MDNNLQLFSFEGQSVLDSRNVAEMIGKRHDHLVRDIDRYIEDIEESPKLGNGSTTAQQLKEKIANAQRFEVQYGGGKEKLVDVVSWEKSGDKQAHMFIETWTKRDPKNLAAYKFIEANGLYTVEKKED